MLITRIKRLSKKEFFWICLILILSILAIYPFFAPGFYTFSDEPHIANLYQMIRAISGGQIPPRWAPDVSFNFGHPLFNFYYPLPFYLGTIFHFIFRTNLVWSLKLVFLLSAPLSGIAFYFLLRKFFNQISSFAGAILYIFTPYRAVDLYVRGAVGEMWGFVFMPLVALCFINLVENKSFRNLGFAALSLGGLILAHNLTPVIFLPFLAIFIGALIWKEKSKWLTVLYCLVSAALGLAISAFYWLPAILEKKFMQSGTPFNPYDHFPFIKQLILPSWGYGASVWGPGDEMSFQIGMINLLVIALAVLSFLISRKSWNKKKTILFLFSIFYFLCSMFMMNIRSWFIWKIIPLGDYIQFPWRFLILTTFFSSLMIGFTQDLLKKKWGRCLPILLALMAIILTLNYFEPAKKIKVDDDYYLRRFFANRTIFGRREIFSEEYLNYSEDYLPLTIWTKQRPSTVPPKVEVDDPNAKIILFEKTPTNFEIEFKNNKEARLTINSYYFSGWQAQIDGERVGIVPGEPYGQMGIVVPAGEHKILVKFGETPLRKIADTLSVLGILTVLGILVYQKK